MTRKLIELAALAWLSHVTLHGLRHAAQRRRALTPGKAHPVLEVWEGEGGALPETGPQLGPDTGKAERPVT